MSYDILKPETPPLKIDEVKELLEIAPTSHLISQELFPDIVQTLSANKYIDYTTIRETFGIKAKKKDFEEGKGIDPQTTRNLIDHFRAIQFLTPRQAELEDAAEEIRTGNKPPSQPQQYVPPAAKRVLPDQRRKAEVRPLR